MQPETPPSMQPPNVDPTPPSAAAVPANSVQPQSPGEVDNYSAQEARQSALAQGSDPAANQQLQNELLLSWSIDDRTPDSHKTTWFVAIGVIGAAIIILAIWLRAWIVIPLGILVPWALSIYANRGIGDHTYQLETFDFSIDKKTYRYDAYKSFFVVENDNLATFELVPNNRFGQLATLHASSVEADDVLEILSSVLPESEPQGYVGESFFKRLRF